MKNILNGFLGICCVVLFYSCGGIETFDSSDTRVINPGTYNYSNVQIDETVHGDVGAGDTTNYKFVQIAYEKPFVSLRIDGDIFEIERNPDIDFWGVGPLGGGEFSYIISVEDYDERLLKMDIVKD